MISSFSWAQEPDFRATATGVLTKHPNVNLYVAEFDLGSLPAGKTGRVELEIVNPFDFDSVSVHCNCVEFVTTHRTIPASGKISGSLNLITPDRQASPNTSARATLNRSKAATDKAGASSLVQLIMNYRLKGLLTIEGRIAVLEIPEGTTLAEANMPFVFTSPLRLNNFVLKTSDSLRDVVFEIRKGKSPETGVVSAVVRRESVMAGPISGEVVLIESKTGKQDSYLLTIKKSDPVVLSPAVIRFRESSDNTEQLVASGLLKIKDRALLGDLTDQQFSGLDPVQISATYGGKAVQVEKRVLGNSVWRLRFTLPRILEIDDGSSQELSSKAKNLQVEIQVKGKKYLLNQGVIQD